VVQKKSTSGGRRRGPAIETFLEEAKSFLIHLHNSRAHIDYSSISTNFLSRWAAMYS
jgi:hypothetical protein